MSEMSDQSECIQESLLQEISKRQHFEAIIGFINHEEVVVKAQAFKLLEGLCPRLLKDPIGLCVATQQLIASLIASLKEVTDRCSVDDHSFAPTIWFIHRITNLSR